MSRRAYILPNSWVLLDHVYHTLCNHHSPTHKKKKPREREREKFLTSPLALQFPSAGNGIRLLVSLVPLTNMGYSSLLIFWYDLFCGKQYYSTKPHDLSTLKVKASSQIFSLKLPWVDHKTSQVSVWNCLSSGQLHLVPRSKKHTIFTFQTVLHQ